MHTVGIWAMLLPQEQKSSLADGIDCRESSRAGIDSERHDLLHAYLNGR